ncbi:hypothetical protein [Aquimarina algiphila]|uniref:hypothetical protein n=1 Tax=Aquimarina algiphila TaxID=2047982 RepID=UPI00232AF346|nr:hypothetical protein [Aquimarina algiphila]
MIIFSSYGGSSISSEISSGAGFSLGDSMYWFSKGGRDSISQLFDLYFINVSKNGGVFIGDFIE